MGYMFWIYLIISIIANIFSAIWRPFSYRNGTAQFFGILSICCLVVGCGISIHSCSTNENKKSTIEDELSGLKAGDYLIVKSNKWANLRSGPSLENASIAKLNNGTKLKFIKKNGNWQKIQIENKIYGFVYGELVNNNCAKTNIDQPSNNNCIEVITHNVANIRKEPSIKSGIVTKAKSGTQFGLVEKVGSWYKIVIDQTKEGFVHKSVVSLGDDAKKNNNKVKISSSTIGGLSLLIIGIAFYIAGLSINEGAEGTN